MQHNIVAQCGHSTCGAYAEWNESWGAACLHVQEGSTGARVNTFCFRGWSLSILQGWSQLALEGTPCWSCRVEPMGSRPHGGQLK